LWQVDEVLPPPGAHGAPIAAPDAFDVPVLVRRSTPMQPERRPSARRIDATSTPWPTPGGLPPAGDYLVTTTWRDLIDAATSVGRDPTAWLTAVPMLAWSEIIARRSPLIAYLSRSQSLARLSGSGFLVEPNVVYHDGTEKTAQAAFGYRIGMTMAEWACRGLMGLGPTAHAESQKPSAAGPDWVPANGLPDLLGDHPIAPSTWLIEAKGGRRLGVGALRKGAAQLSAPGLITGPHMRVLCGASLEHRLFMTIDVEKIQGRRLTRQPRSTDPVDDDDALLALARSRMLLYLALSALPSNARRIVPVGPGVADRGARSGLVSLLEREPSTSSERAAARGGERYWRRGRLERLDMLTGQVPGTDLIIGMSRRLFAACRSLAAVQADLAATVNAERPMARDGDLQMEERDERIQERRLLYWERERAARPHAGDVVRYGFREGQEQTWEELLDLETQVRVNAPAGFLEAATEDTYLAVDARTVTAT
jgi:hypothetical protein